VSALRIYREAKQKALELTVKKMVTESGIKLQKKIKQTTKIIKE
jgi:hypothetical protein